MRGLFHRLAPFTPDSSGVCSVFADMSAVVIPVDMNGTMSTFRGRVGVPDGSPVRICSSLGTRELSYVLGDEEGLLSSFASIVRDQECEFAVLLQGPVSSMVGIDIARLAQQLEERVSLPVLAMESSGNAFYDEGIAAAFQAIFQRMHLRADCRMADALRRQSTFNALGINGIDHHDVRLRERIVRSLAGTAGDMISSWGCAGDWDQWRRASEAELNVVASASALGLAQSMKKAWGIPYRFLDEMGLFLCDETTDLGAVQRAAAGKRILVIGEQIMSNMVRLIMGEDADVVVGSFFGMAKERRRDCDIHLASEAHLVQKLADDDFDVVVGDPALTSFLLPGMRFIPFSHSAIATPLCGRPVESPAPFSKEWLQAAAGSLR